MRKNILKISGTDTNPQITVNGITASLADFRLGSLNQKEVMKKYQINQSEYLQCALDLNRAFPKQKDEEEKKGKKNARKSA